METDSVEEVFWKHACPQGQHCGQLTTPQPQSLLSPEEPRTRKWGGLNSGSLLSALLREAGGTWERRYL